MRKLLLFLGDIIVLYFSLFITLIIRYGLVFDDKLGIHLAPFTIIFFIWLIVFYISNLYDIGFAKNNIQFYSALSYSVIVSIAISLMFFYLVAFFGITPKTNLLIFTIVALLLMAGWRYLFNTQLVKSGSGNNTLIIGNNDQSQELYDFMLANPQLGYNAVGIIDIQEQGVYGILENIIKQKHIRTLVLSPAAYKIPHIIDVFYRLVGFGISFYNLSDFYERVTGRVPLGAIDQVWFLENLSQNSKHSYEIGKRVFDLVGAIIIGLITLPFYPIVILAIKLDSKGDVFYRQRRMGRSSKVFTLIKFRNMVMNAEGNTGPVWAAENDNRTTRVGKFIRKTRIDEIPQIWNILKGEMSFVGPRPERPEFHDKLEREIPFYEERCLIKPGLTGWAQTKYKLDFRGGMTVKDTAEKLQHDLYYIKNRSLLLDLGILLKTVSILTQKALR